MTEDGAGGRRERGERVGRRALRALRLCLAVAFLGCAAGPAAVAAPAVTFGPAFVPVAGSPFNVGTDLDAVAVDPAGSLLAAVDPSVGNVYSLSIDLSSGALTPVSGSPFATGAEPVSVAFSPAGNLLAAANLLDDTVGIFSVSPSGALTAVPGSPFPTGQQPRAIAFSPAGDLLAVADQTDDTVSMFAVGAGGTLIPVSGSFDTGSQPVALSFNPGGSLLAVANEGGNTVTIFTVGPGGALTPSGGSPLSVGGSPSSVAFNPSGTLLAVANAADSTISMFTTGPAAAEFSIVPGSPFASGAEPLSVAFDRSGGLLATADQLDNTTAIFSVAATGGLTLEPGAPYASGGGPHAVAFVPGSTSGSDFVATANNDGTVSVLAGAPPVAPTGPIPPPTPTIVAPTANQSFALGEQVQTRFYCLDSPQGPGIASCTDTAGAKSPFGVLDTKTLGSHTYSITAVSSDGQSATTSVTYTVTSAPLAATKPPTLRGKDAVGQTISCSPGTWSGEPTKFTYQWARNGIPQNAATGSTYRIKALDAGSLLGCAVKGHRDSVSATASAPPVTVPLHPSRGCPAATGSLAPRSLGRLELGDTAKQARAAMRGSKEGHAAGHTQFCLSPDKIEIGFPGKTFAKLLHERRASSHSVWMLTGNPQYSYSNVGIGMSLKSAEKVLNPGVVEQSKRISIYLVREPKSTIVMVANQKGVIQRIGIADSRVTAGAKLRLALAGSVTGSVAVPATQ